MNPVTLKVCVKPLEIIFRVGQNDLVKDSLTKE